MQADDTAPIAREQLVDDSIADPRDGGRPAQRTLQALRTLLQLEAADVARVRAVGAPGLRCAGLDGPTLDVGDRP